MTVRELPCWPPRWPAAATGASHGGKGEHGVLIATRGDLRAQSLTLTMEDAGDRYFAVLRDDARVLTGLALLLEWRIGRSMAQIGSLEMRSWAISPRYHRCAFHRVPVLTHRASCRLALARVLPVVL